jgi:hypothetical protein
MVLGAAEMRRHERERQVLSCRSGTLAAVFRRGRPVIPVCRVGRLILVWHGTDTGGETSFQEAQGTVFDWQWVPPRP